ncbi:MAG: MBL fold metallo-hydrolase [Vicinamibacteria bacterium]
MSGPVLSFHGGAGTVTGSRHLLSVSGRRLLVDAGLFQGLKKLRLLNWQEPDFDPQSVDDLFLTHAHIDHSGYLPRLVRQGYSNPVYCTPATLDLVRLLLLDSAKIQEEDANYANRKGFSKHRPALPLYTSADAEAAFELMRPLPYGEWLELGEGVRARFLNVGHILGSAMVEVRMPLGGKEQGIVFSGDVGRYDMPLHSDPSEPPACNLLVVESTYGDRTHDAKPLAEQITEPFKKVFEQKGIVLIPSFAVGRAQLVTLILRELMNDGRLPEVPIHIDSPMAVNATRIYSRHLEDGSLDDELSEDGRSRLFPRNVQFHRTVDESKELSKLPGPRIIISASGMLTAGRVIHHLRRLLPDKQNLVLLVGYQAAGTRGRALLEGATVLRMHGKDVPVRAKFRSAHGLSAHADRDELIRWLRSSQGRPKTVFVTHGEPDASKALARRVEEEIGARCFVPRLQDRFDLATL